MADHAKKTLRALALAVGIVGAFSMSGVTPAYAQHHGGWHGGGISTGAAVALGLGAFALGAGAYSPYYYGYGYGYPYPYYGYAPAYSYHQPPLADPYPGYYSPYYGYRTYSYAPY